MGNILYAQKVEVISDSMKAVDLEKKVYFIGNAKIKRDKDWLHSNKIIVYFNDNNRTNKYEAIGKVTFEFKDIKHDYKGYSDQVTYYPLKSLYILKGKALVNDIKNNRLLKGSEIVLDMLKGNAKINGSHKRPVKFIFNMESKR